MGGAKSTLHGSSHRRMPGAQHPHHPPCPLLPQAGPHHLFALAGPDQLPEEQVQHSLTVEQPTPAQGGDTEQGWGHSVIAGPSPRRGQAGGQLTL